MKGRNSSSIQVLFKSKKFDTQYGKRRILLSYAIEVRNKSIVKALLDSDKVEIHAKDNKGRTPLSYAASCDVARILLFT
ncbi:hypothetical protein J3E68DRAFT_131023 [Trichoderma sp. SZMC 28012]